MCSEQDEADDSEQEKAVRSLGDDSEQEVVLQMIQTEKVASRLFRTEGRCLADDSEQEIV